MPDTRPPSPIAVALRAMETGERIDAAADLLPMVYDELRRLAQVMIARERPGHTLQATALVHEAYLRVVGQQDPQWNGRRHFFGAATEAMRRILINQARDKARLKRGGGRQRVDLEEIDVPIEAPSEDILAVDEALQKLEAADPRARQIVNLRYFGGFTAEESAAALGVSVTTIEREWRFIRAWMRDALTGDRESESESE